MNKKEEKIREKKKKKQIHKNKRCSQEMVESDAIVAKVRDAC